MKRYKVLRGDFMGMSVVEKNLTLERAREVARIENALCDSYTIVEIEAYEEKLIFKFGR